MDTKKIQLVTFDLDGTMLDDEWAHAEANRRLGVKLGVDHTRLGRLTGYSVRKRWEELCRLAGVEADIEEIAREHFDITLEIVKAEGIPEAPWFDADSADPAGAGIPDGHRVLFG